MGHVLVLVLEAFMPVCPYRLEVFSEAQRCDRMFIHSVRIGRFVLSTIA